MEDGRQLAREMQNGFAEGRALLSLGDVYQQLGQLGQATGSYNEAIEQTQKVDPFVGATTIALYTIQQARA